MVDAKDPIPPVVDVKDCPKAFELICEHLDQHRGLIGNPMLYYVRALLKVLDEADGPSSGYASLDLEMIDRAPTVKYGTTGDPAALELTGPFDPTLLTDVVKVNDILAVMIRPTPAWVYMKPKRSIAPNGRRSYTLIFECFLGPGNMDNLAGNAFFPNTTPVMVP